MSAAVPSASASTASVAALQVDANRSNCWNVIGVHGNASCTQLEQYVHCRNCPVYSAAATALLEKAPPTGYMEDWTLQIMQQKCPVESDTQALLMFRIGIEWLALSAVVMKEIAGFRPIHSVPHRRNGTLLGLTNIRGELQVCVALGHLLNLERSADGSRGSASTSAQASANKKQQMLVIEREGLCVVCPVDEVHGIERFSRQQLGPVPATVARSTATYTQAVVAWNDRSIALLDDQLLFHTINRSLV